MILKVSKLGHRWVTSTFVVALLCFAGSGTAKSSHTASPRVTSFSCGRTQDPELDVWAGAEFKEITSAEALHPDGTKTERFQDLKNNDQDLETEIYATLSPCNQSERSNGGTEVGLKIILHATSKKLEHWWVLPGSEDTPCGKGEIGTEFRLDRNASIEEIGLATADQSLPIFVVTSTSSTSGMNTMYESVRRFLVDFRGDTPRLLATLGCTYSEGGGACGAPDHGWETSSSLNCDWEPVQSQFVCTEETMLPLAWGSRKSIRSFPLDRAAASEDSNSPMNVSELNGLALNLAHGKEKIGSSYRVPSLGLVTSVARLRSRSPGTMMVVFASSNNTDDFDYRFFLAKVGPGETAEISEIAATGASSKNSANQSRINSDAGTRSLPTGGLVEGPEPTFKSRVALRDPAGFQVVQVTATEGNPAKHGVFWIGIDERFREIVTDEIRLATDAILYDHCEQFIHPEGATKIEIRRLPFRAKLRMEPERVGFEDGTILDRGDDDETCAWTRNITWNSKIGFAWDDGKPPCKKGAAPRLIHIDELGRISVEDRKLTRWPP